MNNIKMLHYDRIDVFLITELILIKQGKRKSTVFFTIGIFKIKALSFNQISAMDVMIF